MSPHFEEITAAVVHRIGGPVTHRETVHVIETAHGLSVWEAVVEVFEVDEPPPTRVYGWAVVAGDKAEYIAVVGHPPIDSARTAVKSWLLPHR